MKRFYALACISLLLLLFATTSCLGQKQLTAPDYRNVYYWFAPDSMGKHRVDIFYVYPTISVRHSDSDPKAPYYNDVAAGCDRDKVLLNMRLMRDIYALDSLNFFSPFYRQLTMRAYTDGDYIKLAELSQRDVIRAFRYYMKHLNGGRPFILLGHSQGSEHLVALLKNGMTDADMRKMVAAYLIGWKLTNKEIEAYPKRLIPAKGETDTHCIVMFNSVTNENAQSPLLLHSDVCINPLNWRTDTVYAPKELHKGAFRYNADKKAFVFINNFTGTQIKGHCLICKDVNPSEVFFPQLSTLFPYGCLHLMDSWMYCRNIKENMYKRILHLSDKSDSYSSDRCRK